MSRNEKIKIFWHHEAFSIYILWEPYPFNHYPKRTFYLFINLSVYNGLRTERFFCEREGEQGENMKTSWHFHFLSEEENYILRYSLWLLHAKMHSFWQEHTQSWWKHCLLHKKNTRTFVQPRPQKYTRLSQQMHLSVYYVLDIVHSKQGQANKNYTFF